MSAGMNKHRKYLRPTDHSTDLCDWDIPRDVEVKSHDLVDLLLQLSLDLREEVGFDAVEKEVVLPRLVQLVHLLVEVVVHARDGLHLRRHRVQAVVHTLEET